MERILVFNSLSQISIQWITGLYNMFIFRCILHSTGQQLSQYWIYIKNASIRHRVVMSHRFLFAVGRGWSNSIFFSTVLYTYIYMQFQTSYFWEPSIHNTIILFFFFSTVLYKYVQFHLPVGFWGPSRQNTIIPFFFFAVFI